MTNKEIIDLIKSSSPFEVAACHYWELDKEQLRDLVKEVYDIAVMLLSEEDVEEFNNQVIDNLIEYDHWLGDDEEDL